MICVVVMLVIAPLAGGFELPAAACAGWASGPQRLVLPSAIFKYMDGAGELYLGYGFKKLYVREYEKTGEPKVTCEVYLMPSSADAYGLFSQDRTGTELRIGQSAVYASGLLLAWQGKYFVRLLADRETPEAKRCIVELAKQVVKLCGPPGKPPAALGWLPKKGLDAGSVHYFHTHACLNYFHFVSTQNILNLSLKTEAVMGTYAHENGKSLALVISYPSETESRVAWDKFRQVYMAGLSPSGGYSIVRLENGRWCGGIQQRKRLFLVLEAPTRDDCASLLKRMTLGSKR
ncbi:MAG: DUF6599 family protein [Armatimonadota bacterium]